MTYSQPVVFPFPGYPSWRLWTCSCWRQAMPEGTPVYPAHIETALTIDVPKGGQVISCARCRTSWLYRENLRDWLKLANDCEIPMTGAERLMHYREGVANEALDDDAAAGDTEVDLSKS